MRNGSENMHSLHSQLCLKLFQKCENHVILPLCILRGQGQWLEYGGAVWEFLWEKGRKKEGRKGRRKTASFFFGAPILLKYYYSLLWGPCQTTVATTTSCCLSSNSFSNLCLDCFQFSGQHGLSQVWVCTNDKFWISSWWVISRQLCMSGLL